MSVLCSAGCCLECDACAAKPGSPVLCPECLERRRACAERHATERVTVPPTKPTSQIGTDLTVAAMRLLASAPRGSIQQGAIIELRLVTEPTQAAVDRALATRPCEECDEMRQSIAAHRAASTTTVELLEEIRRALGARADESTPDAARRVARGAAAPRPPSELAAAIEQAHAALHDGLDAYGESPPVARAHDILHAAGAALPHHLTNDAKVAHGPLNEIHRILAARAATRKALRDLRDRAASMALDARPHGLRDASLEAVATRIQRIDVAPFVADIIDPAPEACGEPPHVAPDAIATVEAAADRVCQALMDPELDRVHIAAAFGALRRASAGRIPLSELLTQIAASAERAERGAR